MCRQRYPANDAAYSTTTIWGSTYFRQLLTGIVDAGEHFPPYVTIASMQVGMAVLSMPVTHTNLLIEADWCIYASVKYVIASDNGAWIAPNHYVNPCWLIVMWTLTNKIQWIKVQSDSFMQMTLKCRQRNRSHFAKERWVKAEKILTIWTYQKYTGYYICHSLETSC